jgi:hypothetical protein
MTNDTPPSYNQYLKNKIWNEVWACSDLSGINPNNPNSANPIYPDYISFQRYHFYDCKLKKSF